MEQGDVICSQTNGFVSPPSSHDPLAGKHSSAFLKGKTIGFVGFADFVSVYTCVTLLF